MQATKRLVLGRLRDPRANVCKGLLPCQLIVARLHKVRPSKQCVVDRRGVRCAQPFNCPAAGCAVREPLPECISRTIMELFKQLLAKHLSQPEKYELIILLAQP